MSKYSPVILKLGVHEAKLVMDCLYGPAVVNPKAAKIFTTLKYKLNRHRRALTERKNDARATG